MSGTWSESSRDISGTLQGRGGNGNFQVVASAAASTPAFRCAPRQPAVVSIRAESQFRAANLALALAPDAVRARKRDSRTCRAIG